MMGKPLKYGSSFQLQQKSSSRFLSLQPANNETVSRQFSNKYTDSFCLQFSFSEYPNSSTHMSLEECCLFQKRKQTEVKDTHFVYLTSQYENKTMYAYNVEKYPFMTQSKKTPLIFQLLEHAPSFNTIDTVQEKDLVIITSANKSLYLEIVVRKVITDNPPLLKIERSYNAVFKPWTDFKDISYDAWFTIEPDPDHPHQLKLKHFRSGYYLCFSNKKGVKGDRLSISQTLAKVDIDEPQDFCFWPVDEFDGEVTQLTKDVVFKIFCGTNEDDPSKKSYLRIADDNDIEEIDNEMENNSEQDKAPTQSTGTVSDSEKIIIDYEKNGSIPCVIKEACPINYFDTFVLKFPHLTQCRELTFCKDIIQYFMEFGLNVNNSKEKDKFKLMSKYVPVLSKVFLDVLSYLNNELVGMINPEYSIGKKIPYRQRIMFKSDLTERIIIFVRYLIMILGGNTQTDRTLEEQNEWEDKLTETFRLPESSNSKYETLLDVIFEILYELVQDNQDTRQQILRFMDVFQNYSFIKRIPDILSALFKRNISNKKGDKSLVDASSIKIKEKMYTKMYDTGKIETLVDYFIKKLRMHKNPRYLKILSCL